MTKQDFQKQVLPAQDKLFRIALVLLKNRQDAEDVLQEVYLKLWNMRTRLAAYRSVEALAVTMTKNRCIDRLRSYRSRKQDATEVESLNPSGGWPDPEESAATRESAETIRRLVSELPEQQRLVMHLRDIEQYEYEEIEEMTGLTLNNIRVTLSRARRQVREAYLSYQDYERGTD